MKRTEVALTESDLALSRRKVSSGASTAREIAHARVLLGSREGLSASRGAREAGVSQATLDRIRRRFAEGGLEARSPGAANPSPREA